MKFVLLFVWVVSLSGCASTHDLASGPNHFGGGVSTIELKPGFFRVLARTNWAPWNNFDAARRSWEKLANSTCGEGKWKEIASKEQAQDVGVMRTPVPYIVTEKIGYVLCKNSQMTVEEARALAIRQVDMRAADLKD